MGPTQYNKIIYNARTVSGIRRYVDAGAATPLRRRAQANAPTTTRPRQQHVPTIDECFVQMAE